jgi:predicted phage terminase large subunit-like protein
MKLAVVLHEDGPALDPVRWPVEVMERRRASSVGRVWRSLYQQDPTDIDGNLFKEVWWQIYEKLPSLVRACIYVDSAYKAGVSSDWSVCALWGKGVDGNAYLIDVRRARLEFPELVEFVLAMRAAHIERKPPVVVEDRSSGQALVPILKKRGVLAVPWKHNIKGLRSGASKLARMEAITPLVEAGRAWIPARASWREDWLAEHRAVPTGAHDDMVDTTVMALDHLLGAVTIEAGPSLPFRDRDVPSLGPLQRMAKRRIQDDEDAELERWREAGLL